MPLSNIPQHIYNHWLGQSGLKLTLMKNNIIRWLLTAFTVIFLMSGCSGVISHTENDDAVGLDTTDIEMAFTIPYMHYYGDKSYFNFPHLDIAEQKKLENIIQHVKSKGSPDGKTYYIKPFKHLMFTYCMVKQSSQLDIDDYDGYAIVDGELCFIISRDILKTSPDTEGKHLHINIDREHYADLVPYDPNYFLYQFTVNGIKYIPGAIEKFHWADI